MHPELIKKLRENGLEITPDRIGMNRHESEWCAVGEVNLGSHVVKYATFGDWKKSEQKFSWKDGEALTPIGETVLKIEMAKQRKAADLERQAKQEQVAAQAAEFWDIIIEPQTNAYCQKKGVKMYGVRGDKDTLIVPMYDIDGRIWSHQKIFANGSKRFLSGGRKKSLYLPLGEGCGLATHVYLCEGYATGASIKEAMPEWYVVVCFDAGNLKAVAEVIKEKYPDTLITACADNDQWGEENTGVKAAIEAVGTRNVLVPEFKNLDGNPTDFNDLHQLEGLDEVRRQLTGVELKEVKAEKSVESKAKKGPPEIVVVKSLLGEFQGNLLKQGKDLFLWKTTHWEHLSQPRAEDHFKKIIDARAGGKYEYAKISSCYNRFLIHIPTPDRGHNMFAPIPMCANFLDGTLEFHRKPDHTYDIQFREHRQSDYLTWVLPYEYRGKKGLPKEEFEAMLKRIWKEDVDFEGKRRLFAQICGAALIPLFPTIALFIGKPKTGKSTLLKLISQLVDKDNLCGVQPSEWKRFNLTTMVGKLVNIDTDIKTHQPFEDDVVKKVIDRRPFRVERKFQDDIYGCIPALHCFGANNLPQLHDGESRAYDRRIVILETEKFQPVGDYDKDFDVWLWEKESAGIIGFALEGLEDLAKSRGHYHVPASSHSKVVEMQERGDLIALFLNDLKEGLIPAAKDQAITENKTGVLRSALWDCFKGWMEEVSLTKNPMGRNAFYVGLRNKGIVDHRIEGGRYFVGLGTVKELF